MRLQSFCGMKRPVFVLSDVLLIRPASFEYYAISLRDKSVEIPRLYTERPFEKIRRN